MHIDFCGKISEYLTGHNTLNRHLTMLRKKSDP